MHFASVTFSVSGDLAEPFVEKLKKQLLDQYRTLQRFAHSIANSAKSGCLVEY